MNNDYNSQQILDQMADNIRAIMNKKNIQNPYMVGLHTAGVWIAKALYQRLADDLGIEDELGELNSNYYRDDFHQRGLSKQTLPSKLPISLEGRHIILVDDILFTGRTTRAAINELFEYGRIASITLVVLLDRKGRELPIEAQVVGLKKELPANQSIKVTDPEELTLEIRHDNE